MSEAEETPEEYVVVQCPDHLEAPVVERVAEAVEANLPDDVGCLILGAGLKTLSREELAETLEVALEEVRHGEHRLAGAEPAEQPADPPWEDEDEA